MIMKKNILITIVAFVAFSCETKTVEVENGGGEIMMGDYAGEKLFFASDETVEIAKNMLNAYANKDFDLVNQYAADTVYFKPPQGGEYIPIANPANDFLEGMTNSYDSIIRNIRSIVPLKRKDGEVAGVYINFDEALYGKDGSVTKSNIIDRVWIRDGKVFRIEQWVAESN